MQLAIKSRLWYENFTDLIWAEVFWMCFMQGSQNTWRFLSRVSKMMKIIKMNDEWELGFKLPPLGFVLVQTEEAMRCLRDIERPSSISSTQGPHCLFFYSKCQYTVAPAVTLCCFVLLSQLGLTCWSFSGWLHHCICLPAVPHLSPCRNLESFKKTKKKKKEIRIDLFSQTLVLS